MYTKIKIVKVDYKYCNYLRKFDNKVPYNAGIKELRPFIGILFIIDNYEVFDLNKKNLLPNNVLDGCCNFPLLEIKCKEYNNK